MIAAELGSEQKITGLKTPVKVNHIRENATYGKQPPTNDSLQVLLSFNVIRFKDDRVIINSQYDCAAISNTIQYLAPILGLVRV